MYQFHYHHSLSLSLSVYGFFIFFYLGFWVNIIVIDTETIISISLTATATATTTLSLSLYQYIIHIVRKFSIHFQTHVSKTKQKKTEEFSQYLIVSNDEGWMNERFHRIFVNIKENKKNTLYSSNKNNNNNNMHHRTWMIWFTKQQKIPKEKKQKSLYNWSIEHAKYL